MISTDQLAALPVYYHTTIAESDLDAMGHLNVRRYVAFFDDAGWAFYAAIGMTPEYFRAAQAGGFSLEMHIRYLAEVHLGETIAVRIRLLARTVKRMHFIGFMVNETTGALASTLEQVDSHADLAARRTSPFPAEIAAKLDAVLAEHQHLDWDAPVCGVMKA